MTKHSVTTTMKVHWLASTHKPHLDVHGQPMGAVVHSRVADSQLTPLYPQGRDLMRGTITDHPRHFPNVDLDIPDSHAGAQRRLHEEDVQRQRAAIQAARENPANNHLHFHGHVEAAARTLGMAATTLSELDTSAAAATHKPWRPASAQRGASPVSPIFSQRRALKLRSLAAGGGEVDESAAFEDDDDDYTTDGVDAGEDIDPQDVCTEAKKLLRAASTGDGATRATTRATNSLHRAAAGPDGTFLRTLISIAWQLVDPTFERPRVRIRADHRADQFSHLWGERDTWSRHAHLDFDNCEVPEAWSRKPIVLRQVVAGVVAASTAHFKTVEATVESLVEAATRGLSCDADLDAAATDAASATGRAGEVAHSIGIAEEIVRMASHVPRSARLVQALLDLEARLAHLPCVASSPASLEQRVHQHRELQREFSTMHANCQAGLPVHAHLAGHGFAAGNTTSRARGARVNQPAMPPRKPVKPARHLGDVGMASSINELVHSLRMYLGHAARDVSPVHPPTARLVHERIAQRLTAVEATMGLEADKSHAMARRAAECAWSKYDHGKRHWLLQHVLEGTTGALSDANTHTLARTLRDRGDDSGAAFHAIEVLHRQFVQSSTVAAQAEALHAEEEAEMINLVMAMSNAGHHSARPHARRLVEHPRLPQVRFLAPHILAHHDRLHDVHAAASEHALVTMLRDLPQRDHQQRPLMVELIAVRSMDLNEGNHKWLEAELARVIGEVDNSTCVPKCMQRCTGGEPGACATPCEEQCKSQERYLHALLLLFAVHPTTATEPFVHSVGLKLHPERSIRHLELDDEHRDLRRRLWVRELREASLTLLDIELGSSSIKTQSIGGGLIGAFYTVEMTNLLNVRRCSVAVPNCLALCALNNPHTRPPSHRFAFRFLEDNSALRCVTVSLPAALSLGSASRSPTLPSFSSLVWRTWSTHAPFSTWVSPPSPRALSLCLTHTLSLTHTLHLHQIQESHPARRYEEHC